MDARAFQAEVPGELVDLGGDECAFVPAPLPPAWPWPVHLWPLLVRAKEQLARLDGLTKNLPDPGIFVRPLQQREAMRSSSLEGTYASPRELLLFDLQPDLGLAASTEGTAWREVHNYNAALRHGAATVAERGLPFSLIQELHTILLTGVRGRDRTPGRFRTEQVFIGVNHRFTPPPVTHLASCLDQLRTYLAAPTGDHDPLVRCFLVHYQFETIHPFSDGNGRVGRLLLSLMIQAWCRTSGPWLYLSAFFDHHKDEYIDRLFAVSARSQWSEWVELCLRATIEQATDTIARCERLLSLWKDYRRRVDEIRGASARLVKIIEGLFANAFVRVADLPARLDVTYPTAKADTDRLLTAGILREVPAATPRTLYAHELFEVAFAEPDGPPSVER